MRGGALGGRGGEDGPSDDGGRKTVGAVKDEMLVVVESVDPRLPADLAEPLTLTFLDKPRNVGVSGALPSVDATLVAPGT